MKQIRYLSFSGALVLVFWIAWYVSGSSSLFGEDPAEKSQRQVTVIDPNVRLGEPTREDRAPAGAGAVVAASPVEPSSTLDLAATPTGMEDWDWNDQDSAFVQTPEDRELYYSLIDSMRDPSNPGALEEAAAE